ncbi:2-dehydro-3-deoxy-6-phosphogalactonate aldolase [Rhodobacteraceae bacterium (ex Bugula neritina AB1)]|nr:2-dehydro-3-deoxy-6-phosphogalactonate aldolase [Rhodobacteraceae bacterium (ex Bugula neritina AB1)]
MPREIIAILRGVQPNEVLDIGKVLVEAGITTIEVPMNSPEPLKSIEGLSETLLGEAHVGAGTVLSVSQVHDVASAGGQLIVSPDANPDVIGATKVAGLDSYPGVASPSECFTALRNGADGLKFFPSFLVGPAGLSAISAVLPKGTKTYAVGGVGPDNFADWFDAGITGFGIGSGIYKAGFTASEVKARAEAIVAAYDHAHKSC